MTENNVACALQEFRIDKLRKQHDRLTDSGRRLVRRGRLTSAIEYIQSRIENSKSPDLQLQKIFNPSWQAKQKAENSIRWVPNPQHGQMHSIASGLALHVTGPRHHE